MTMITLIIAIAALLCACVALIVAWKKNKDKVTEVIKTEQVVKVEHPFTYDEEKGVYVLNGDLEVTGGISALKVAKKRTKKTKAGEEKA